VIVGPSDLSLSLGALQQYENPKFSSAMQRIVDSARKHHVTAGMLATDDVRKRAAQGFKLLNISGDLWLLKEAATRLLKVARDATS